jgi:tRNA(fMet)-specific endonuclease VapC
LKEKNRIIYKKFIEVFEIMNFDGMSLNEYAKIRLNLERDGSIIGLNDLFIASTVLAHNGISIAHNTKEFERIPELHIEDWVK